ncbi:MAG: aldolase/citrate lyase family protein [Vicinamibacterales bacterium]
MKQFVLVLTTAAALTAGALATRAQSPAPAPAPQGQTPAPTPASQGQTPAPTADPYANNAAPDAAKFPLAAPAGVDSRARETAPAGAANTGPFDPATWKYGGAFSPQAGATVWNPVKVKMQQGGTVTGGTLFAATDPSTYCAMANAGYDFIWTEMQHDQRDWESVSRMWRTCPHARAVPGVRVAYTDEREIQHALDAGALVLVVPTVDTVEEAREVVEWTYFPPLGRRSNGGGQAFDGAMWGGVPGGYRATANDNIVLVLMIETLEGLKNAADIARVPGVSALFAASGDLGNFTGYRQGQPDSERAINIVHDAAIGAGVRLCGPFSWRDRPDFTCFQTGSETAASARGVAAPSWGRLPTRRARWPLARLPDGSRQSIRGGPHRRMGKSRLEAFSDGVLAIVIDHGAGVEGAARD